MTNKIFAFLKEMIIEATFIILALAIFLYGGFYVGGLVGAWAFEGIRMSASEENWFYECLRIFRLILFFSSCLILPLAFLLSFKAIYSIFVITGLGYFFFVILDFIGLKRLFVFIFGSQRGQVKETAGETEKTFFEDEHRQEQTFRKALVWIFVPLFAVPPVVTLFFGILVGFFTSHSWLTVVGVYLAVGIGYGFLSYAYFWLALKLGIMSEFFIGFGNTQ